MTSPGSGLGALCCPACRGALALAGSGSALDCVSCGERYPIVDSIPILVPDPGAYLRRSLVAAEASRRKIEASIAEIERLRSSPAQAFRQESLERGRGVLALNLTLIAQQEQQLRAHATRLALPVHRAGSLATRALDKLGRAAPPLRKFLGIRKPLATGYDLDSALRFLQLDWSRAPEAEQHVATLRAAVAKSLGTSASAGSAVYLGAGLGRHAHEGASLFGSVLAVDLSFAAAALLTSLRRGPLEFGWLNWQNATSAADFAIRWRAALPPESGFSPKVQFIAGDALALPVADASQDAVVSVFFTDMAPLSKLVPEVKRVLKPGGKLISVGPLHYAFADKAERLTRDELRWALEHLHGMRVEPGDEMFDVPYAESAGGLKSSFLCWRFAATR